MFQEDVMNVNKTLQNVTIKIKTTFMFFQNKIFIISTLEQIWKIVFIVIQNTNVFCETDISFPFF